MFGRSSPTRADIPNRHLPAPNTLNAVLRTITYFSRVKRGLFVRSAFKIFLYNAAKIRGGKKLEL